MTSSDVSPFFNRGKSWTRFYDRLRRSCRLSAAARRRYRRGGAWERLRQTGADRHAERQDHLSRQARDRYEGGLQPPGLRASGKRLHSCSRSRFRHAETIRRCSHTSTTLSRRRRRPFISSARSADLRRRRGARTDRQAAACAGARTSGRRKPIQQGTIFAGSSGRRNFSTWRLRPQASSPNAIRFRSLERFDVQTATDKIDGDILGKFVEFLFQYLTETAPRPVAGSPAATSPKFFSPITLPTKNMPARSQRRSRKARSTSTFRYLNRRPTRAVSTTILWSNATQSRCAGPTRRKCGCGRKPRS